MRRYGVPHHRQIGVMFWLLMLFTVTGYGARAGTVFTGRGGATQGVISTAASVTARPTLGRGVFLVAGRNMNGPLFTRTVILITQYNDNGTVGLIINRPLQIPAAHALPPLSGLNVKSGMVHMGGPVAVNALQLLIRAASTPDGAEPVFGDVYLVNDSASLKSILGGNAQITAVRLYAGYAGWAPGQLEKELLHGDWYLWPADADSIFSLPAASVWRQLIGRAAAQWVWWKPPATRLPRPAPRPPGGAVIDATYPETSGRGLFTRTGNTWRTGPIPAFLNNPG